MSSVLEISGLAKSFGPVRVLDGVSLSVGRGRVLGLCGENGAGKSTLLRCVAGQLEPDAGTVRIDAGGDGRVPCRMVPQEPALVEGMTVAENLYLGREIVRRGLLDRAAMRAGAQGLLAATGTDLPADAPVASLGLADRQKIEIARAFLQKAALLLFDEPTTVFDAEETEAFFETIRAFRDGGGSAVYVSHRLEEVLRICDDVAVLRDGALVALRPASAFTPATLAESMVGRPLSRLYPPKSPWRGDDSAPPALEAEGLSDGGRVRNASLRLRAGEVLGLAGLAGSGRTELALTLCGAVRPAAGTVRLFGREVRFRSVAEALDAGVAYLPEDRQAAGVLPDFSVADNATLASLRAYRRGPFLAFARRDAAVRRRIAEMRVRCEGPAAPARSLSGGTSRRSFWPRGSTRTRASCSSTSRRAASTSARAPKSTPSSVSWRTGGWRCC